MRIALGGDHRGFSLKEELKKFLRSEGYVVDDKGPSSDESVDYPDFGALVAQQVSSGLCDRGILICSTGIGMSVVANKFPRVRAALCTDLETARQCREHIDANVLVLAGSRTSSETATMIVNTWLETPFQGGRHQRRVEKIAALETQLFKP
jgi:RpiB/LacA/LacB family sugar-phosphate isomerase